MADVYRDLVYTRNTSAIGTADTSIQVEDVSLFPSSVLLAKSDFWLTIESSLSYPNTFEIVKLTSVNTSTKTLTVVRAQAGTVASAHSIATYIKGTLTSDMLRRVRSGLYGTTLPAPDADIFLPGDRFYHQTEARYYAFTGYAANITDSFTRAANVNTLGTTETGNASWNNVTGVWGVSAAGHAAYQSGAVGNQTLALLNVGSTDFDLSFQANTGATGTNNGFYFRSTMDGQFGYYLAWQPGVACAVYRVNNGTATQWTTFASTVANTTYTWHIVASGTNTKIYLNGTLQANLNEATPPAQLGANVGPFINGSFASGLTDANIWYDNFTCTSATSTPGGWQPTADVTGAFATFQSNGLISLERIQGLQSQQIDDLQAALTAEESRVVGSQIALEQVAIAYDELLATSIVDDRAGMSTEAAVATVAHQVDEILAVLQQNAQTGYGAPGSSVTALQGITYVDLAANQLWIYNGSNWSPIASTSVATPYYLGSSGLEFNASGSYYIQSIAPAGVQTGDLCLVLVLSAQALSPSSLNVLQCAAVSSTPVNGYYAGLYWRIVDTDTGGPAQYWTGNAATTVQVRYYRNASMVGATISQATGPGSGPVAAPAMTGAAVGDLVAHFWAEVATTGTVGTARNYTFDSRLTNTFTRTYGGTSYGSTASADEFVRTAGAVPSANLTLPPALMPASSSFFQFSVDIRGIKPASTVSTAGMRGPWSSLASYAASDIVTSGGWYSAPCSLPAGMAAPGSTTVTPPTSGNTAWTYSGTTPTVPLAWSGSDPQVALPGAVAVGSYNSALLTDGLRITWTSNESAATYGIWYWALQDASAQGVPGLLTVNPIGGGANSLFYSATSRPGLYLSKQTGSSNNLLLRYGATQGALWTATATASFNAGAGTDYAWDMSFKKQSNGQYLVTISRAGSTIFSVTTPAPDVAVVQFGLANAAGSMTTTFKNVVFQSASGPWVPLPMYAPTSPWTTGTLLNSWTNTGGGYASASYYVDAAGWVNLRGMIQGGAVGSTALTLPVGFRPEYLTPLEGVAYTSGAPAGAAFLTVDTAGNISVLSPGSTSTALDGCRFRAYQ